MTAKTAAIKDIKAELKKSSACFLAFHKELDCQINNIVEYYLNEQASLETSKL